MGNGMFGQRNPGVGMEDPMDIGMDMGMGMPPQQMPDQQNDGGLFSSLRPMQIAGIMMAAGMPINEAMSQMASMQNQRQQQEMQNYRFEMMKQKYAQDQEKEQEKLAVQQQNMMDFEALLGGTPSSYNQSFDMGNDIASSPSQANTLADALSNSVPISASQYEMDRPAASNTEIPDDVRTEVTILARQGNVADAVKLLRQWKQDARKSAELSDENSMKQNRMTSNDIFDKENKLRDEFINQSKAWMGFNSAYGIIKASGSEPSAAGDMALVYNFMKMLDEGSTVRETEYANATNAAGVPDRIRAIWNNLQDGQTLAPTQRADFLDRAKKLNQVQMKNQRILEKRYEGLARRNKLNPENIIIKYDEDDNQTGALQTSQPQQPQQPQSNPGRYSNQQLEAYAEEAIRKGANPEAVRARLAQLRGGQ